MHAKGVKHPIYLRKGTTDILNYRAIFERKEYDFLDIDLKNMLDLGGYIGLASIFVANKFPDARILLVEPDPDNFLMAQINCRAYENIKCMNVGVWSHSCKLISSGQRIGELGGDYGKIFAESRPHDSNHGIQAFSVKDLMELENSRFLDFCKIDIEGSEKVLFDAPNAEDWVKKSCIISCEFHDRMVPGCTESAEKLFRKLNYSKYRQGEYSYFKNNNFDH